ncbi:single-stranded DNA-binding protein [candidate division WWE3 bacterium]|uniref:Single-stranded DNA-binding protein n=1 Tax=candidate division WWE3 bacterium TaxID=2053526 RepID=A0A955RX44_UNCKA|nr:single-stranded DNA-binding protein [candidate division WWE3 bacterium]
MATRSVNKAIVMGNMVRDPELRYTSKGTAICTFTLATNREWSANDSNEVNEETEYHNIVTWSKLAELCSDLLYKGRRVYIEGRIQTRDWTDEESGKKMYRTEIVAEEMIALGPPKGGGSDESPAPAPSAKPAAAPAATADPSNDLQEVTDEVQLRDDSSSEDIPF